MNFGKRLMELRKKKGLSQEQLGEIINVTRQTISKWELGESSPDMDKLIALSELFEISLDEFIKGDENKKYSNNVYYTNSRFIMIPNYEYKSKSMIFGLPLVHINLGIGLKRAKGIIAIGNIATGLVSIGGISAGLLSLGGISFGLLSFGGLAVALLLALGGVSIGALAIGGFALGFFAMGGFALGVYSIGGCAIASRVAAGGFAQGFIAIGDKTSGVITFNINNITDPTLIKNAVLREFPSTPKFIISLLGMI